ncbi:hypothetical protein [Streptomyces sp. GESEQ-35]|uniref:hypothetical protein n=1 Tax=Streptomyces sp. GESEQ-35 TaxID=2812657 RepID=UPI001B3212A2|nr:hypothetical protein [Streptomyces sp. GESEQ-35]
MVDPRLELRALVDAKPRTWLLDDAATGRPFRTKARPLSPGDPGHTVVWCAPDGTG